MQQAQTVLPQILPQLGIKTKAAEEAVAKTETTNGDASQQQPQHEKKEPVKVTDIKAFRDGMALHPASRAVKDLSEFEEIESKL